ncbi:uncharacterized protein LOC132736888 [Ruditapes philippinarum]|uniref:uncharacterized protein LOC132736888 n=1 Tax=Ruditapes philippinarum TaxID=129788 RepID=UPI00295C22E7|nr:uncharacterized protein LOC132736888 [Ruditapes philippinarum]
MVKCKRKELLYHPLVSAYLKRTWKPTGIIAISAYFTLYAVFLALLTGFTLSLKAPYQFNRNSSSNTSNCTDTVDHIPAFASKAKYALHVLAPIEIIIEYCA